MTRPLSHLPFLWLVALTALVASAAPAAADIVHLKNGQTLRGEAVESGAEVAIRSAMGELRLPATLVVRIERGASPEQEAIRRLGDMRADDVAGRLELADDLQDEGEATLARRVYVEVLELDPDNPIARRSLGYVRCDGAWTSEEECHRRRGEVLYDGQWISAEQRTMLETLALQRRQAELERMRAQVQLEAARLDAERLASAMAYQGAGGDSFGDPFDPYYGASAGAPFWPTTPLLGFGAFDPFFDGRRHGKGGIDPRGGHFGTFHGGRHGFGAGGRHGFDRGRGFDHGKHSFDAPRHHRGGQPPRPLVPRHHRGTLAPVSRGPLPAPPPSGG